jgi:hypothetical protein
MHGIIMVVIGPLEFLQTYTTGVNPNVNSGLLIMYQCWAINLNKCTALVGNAENEGGGGGGGVGRIWKIL